MSTAEYVATHYSDVIMTTMASQSTSFTVVYSIVYSDADQRKHESSASLCFVRGIHRWSVNSQHKGPVTRKMFPFDGVIMMLYMSQPAAVIVVYADVFTPNSLRAPIRNHQADLWQLCAIEHKTQFTYHVRSSKHMCYSRHHSDIIMGAMASQITSLAIVYSTVYSGADQRKYQSYASLASVCGIHRWPVNSSHQWPVTRKMFPFDDVIMERC